MPATRVLTTQVAIIGAGPAGLVLAHLLGIAGIRSVVVERHSRRYLETRTRAGLLEQGIVELLHDSGASGRVADAAHVHEGFELCVAGIAHRLSTVELAGRSASMFPQQEVVRDLISARRASGAPPLFEVPDVSVTLAGQPAIHGTVNGTPTEIRADFVAGCDGFHGVSRQAIPATALTVFERTFPFGWLGILAQAPPVSAELVYNCHDRGFSLHSMRTPQISRQYLQVDADEDLANWPDERIWAELLARLGQRAVPGPVLEKGITAMRSFVAEPMQYGRLFLAGDSAHIVPPTAAKGLNLAVEDARDLARAMESWYAHGNRDPLDDYSAARLRAAWLAQDFSVWLTDLLHTPRREHAFDRRARLARLHHLATSPAAGRAFAEHYTGLARAASPFAMAS
jgi:p-hydroxybenzoate 3-monooxygenase